VAWTKEALEAEVDALGTGEELERFAAGLDDDERVLLQDVLLERSGVKAYSAKERAETPGWLRRMWDRADPAGRERPR
jgi:hypothetical protein